MDAMEFTDDRKRLLSLTRDHNSLLVSRKHDGVRNLATVDVMSGITVYKSRSGKFWPNFNTFDEWLRWAFIEARERLGDRYGHYWFDGEVTDKTGKFDRVMTQVRRTKDIDPSIFVFHVFDIGGTDLPLDKRLKLLDRIGGASNVKIVEHIPLGDTGHSAATIDQMVEDGKANGVEGYVLKAPTSLYLPGQTTPWWVKEVTEERLDLPVVGTEWGTGKHVNRLGALVCRMPDGSTVKVGTGFTDAEREEFIHTPPGLVEVEFKGFTKDGSLRHPRFKRVREDKPA